MIQVPGFRSRAPWKMKKFAYCFLMFVMLICIWLVALVNYNPTSNTPEVITQKIFGTPQKADDSGLVKFQMSSDTDAIIEYRLFPVGISNVKKEIGILLTPKIKSLYDQVQLNEVTFIVYCPYQDNYGNITWKPNVSFTTTREIFEKINLDNFEKDKLFLVAKEVEHFR